MTSSSSSSSLKESDGDYDTGTITTSPKITSTTKPAYEEDGDFLSSMHYSLPQLGDHKEKSAGKYEFSPVTGQQNHSYFVGEQVFAKCEGFRTWPGRIEDPSNVLEYVGKHQYVVFFYGIHERKVVDVVDIYAFEANKESFGKKTSHRIVNIALREAVNEPTINDQRIPMHKRQTCRIRGKTRSHARLDRMLDENRSDWRLLTDSEQQDITSTSAEMSELFANRGFLSYDNYLGYFCIIASFALVCYLTCWIVVLPFTQPDFQDLIEDMFPNPQHGLAYPVAGGLILSTAIIAFVGAVCYAPRVYGMQWMVMTAQHKIKDPVDRHERMKQMVRAIRKHRPAILITLVLTVVFLTPFRAFALLVILFGGYHFVYDLLTYC